MGRRVAPRRPRRPPGLAGSSITASVAANELARSMGMRDLYPFALTSGVRAKVEFCWHLLPIPVA